ncbi:MAG: hypothetical protein WC531_02495 [Candidatus Paceibacterota bacterium]|jgi:hypothetical protein
MTKLISVSDLFKNAWAIYREKFALVVGLLVLPFLLLVVSQLLMLTQNGLASALAVLIGLASGVGILWGSASLILALRDRTQKLTIKEAYRLGWTKKLWSLIWVAILATFIVGGGYWLFLIPGIILTVWLMFAQVLVLVENEKGMKAIVKSREYTRGYFWPILGRYVLMAIAVTLVYAILMFLVGLVTRQLGGLSFAILNSLLGVIVSVLVTPWAVIYLYLVYENLKQIKGGSVVVNSAKKQGIWYLVIGLVGWILIIIAWVFFAAILVALFGGLFLGQALSNLANQSPAMMPRGMSTFPTTLPAGLTKDQQKLLETQMATLKTLQDQLKNLPAGMTVPAN